MRKRKTRQENGLHAAYDVLLVGTQTDAMLANYPHLDKPSDKSPVALPNEVCRSFTLLYSQSQELFIHKAGK